jgi:hypothetical protein
MYSIQSYNKYENNLNLSLEKVSFETKKGSIFSITLFNSRELIFIMFINLVKIKK